MIQPVKFYHIDDFIEFIPDQERAIVSYLRNIIYECIPQVKEKLAYNVPYYYRYSRIAYIWPASVPWGNVPLQGVSLGFCRGNQLRDDLNWLEKGTRKQVYTKTFFSLKEIDDDLLRTYLFEAMEVDERNHKAKRNSEKQR